MWSTVTGKVLKTCTASGHDANTTHEHLKAKIQKRNMFAQLTQDYSVYEAHPLDVSYKRDFTRYEEHTNSLIFKKLKPEE